LAKRRYDINYCGSFEFSYSLSLSTFHCLHFQVIRLLFSDCRELDLDYMRFLAYTRRWPSLHAASCPSSTQRNTQRSPRRSSSQQIRPFQDAHPYPSACLRPSPHPRPSPVLRLLETPNPVVFSFPVSAFPPNSSPCCFDLLCFCFTERRCFCKIPYLSIIPLLSNLRHSF
jgi:hypothetical protein